MIQREHLDSESFIAGQNVILKQIATGGSLSKVLTDLVRLVEAQGDEMLCSVLLLDEDCLHLRHGAAPSLPKSYVEGVDGLTIGPNSGSCGTAAYFAKPVMVTDVLKDPRWDDYRELAVKHGLRACWSTPILSHNAELLGTFAMYYRVPRGPLPEEERLMKVATHIASIAIENRQAQESLRKSEERYRALVSASSQDVWRTNERGEAFFVTTAWTELTGQSLDEIKGFGWLEAVHSEDRPGCIAAWKRAEQEKCWYENEFRVRSRNGTYRTFQCRGVPILRDDGSIREWVGANSDVTDKKQFEQSLRESEGRSRAILRAIPDSIFLLSSDFTFIECHPRDTCQLSVPPDKPLGKNIREVLPPAIAEKYIRCFQAVSESGELQIAEYDSAFDGKTHNYEARVVLTSDGKFLVVVRDITERKLAEEVLLEREREVNASNAKIRELARKLLTAQEEERRHISLELHDDLNQQMAALSIMISHIKNKVPSGAESLKSELDKVQRLSLKISESIRRLSHELHPPALEHVGLASALRSYVAEFSRIQGIQIKMTAADAAGTISPEAALCLYRVAQESLSNIVKHSGAKTAEVTLSTDDREVHLDVADSGSGFDLASARHKGGLGLASMEERIRLLSGTLTISTQLGLGSRLQATIPLRK